MGRLSQIGSCVTLSAPEKDPMILVRDEAKAVYVRKLNEKVYVNDLFYQAIQKSSFVWSFPRSCQDVLQGVVPAETSANEHDATSMTDSATHFQLAPAGVSSKMAGDGISNAGAEASDRTSPVESDGIHKAGMDSTVERDEISNAGMDEASDAKPSPSAERESVMEASDAKIATLERGEIHKAGMNSTVERDEIHAAGTEASDEKVSIAGKSTTDEHERVTDTMAISEHTTDAIAEPPSGITSQLLSTSTDDHRAGDMVRFNGSQAFVSKFSCQRGEPP